MVRWILQPFTWPGLWISTCSGFVLIATFQTGIGGPITWENLFSLGVMWAIVSGVVFIFCWIFGFVKIDESDRVLDPWQKVTPPPSPEPHSPESPEEFLNRTFWDRWVEVEREKAGRVKRED